MTCRFLLSDLEHGIFTARYAKEACLQQLSKAIGSLILLQYTKMKRKLAKPFRESGIAREEFFVTSKVWTSELGYEKTKIAFENTLSRLGLDYLDLYLIHWPVNAQLNAESWRAMEELYNDGRIRAIGVSNFSEEDLLALFETAMIIPAVNQVEFHPFYQREELHKFLDVNKIKLEAWYPLANGSEALFSNPVLNKIAKAHGRDVSQIILRWHMQKNVIAIPRSSNNSHIKNNISIWDFELTVAEMNEIEKLDTGKELYERF
jgi:diketogulonate reductase-like aldo/keto reductase